jgi:hypothetical protein
MLGQFNNSDFSLRINPGYPKPALANFISILRIETIVAAKLFGHGFSLIELMHHGTWPDFDLLRYTHKRTTQFAD